MNLKSLLAFSDRGDTTFVDPQATVWPLHPLADQVFGDLRFGLPALLQGGAMPRMDVVERDGRIEVSAELPGLSREEVRIELADDTLVISGEKRQEKDETKGSRKITERSYGAFARTLDLPPGIKAEDIEANMDKGILTVRLPKGSLMTSAPKRIEIKAA